MMNRLYDKLFSRLERLVGLPTHARSTRPGPGWNRSALFRGLGFEDLEHRTLLAANLGFAFNAGSTQDDASYAVATDAIGNFYITGEFRGTVDFDLTAGVTNLTSVGDGDVFIAKYSTNGNLIWARSVGSTGSDGGVDIAVDAGGNVTVAGWFTGTIDLDPGAGTNNHSGSGYTDAFVLQLDAGGNHVWGQTFSGTGDTLINAVTVDSSGNVIAAGAFNGTTDFDPGAGVANESASGFTDAFVVKLDAGGDFVWVDAFGGSGANAVFDVTHDLSDNLYITGSFGGTIDFDPGGGVLNLISFGNSDVFVARLDATGDPVWVNTFGGSGDDIGRALALDGAGNVIITGTFENTVDFRPGIGTSLETSEGGSDIFVTKVTVNGGFLWSQGLGGGANEDAYDVAVDSGDNILVSGLFNSTGNLDLDGDTLTDITVAFPGSGVAVRLDPTGGLVWAGATGDNGNTYGYGIATDSVGGVYITGSFDGTTDVDLGAGTFSLTSAGGEDVFVVKLLDNAPPTTTGIPDVVIKEDDPTTFIDLYPVFDDAEDSDSQLFYQIANVSNPALFGVLGLDQSTGQLSFRSAPNQFGTSTLTIRATDSSGNSVATTFQVTVIPVNDQPTTNGITNVTVFENSPNTVINLLGTFADVEDVGAALSYVVTGISDPTLFTSVQIDTEYGELILEYADGVIGNSAISIRAIDSFGAFVDTVFQVNVVNTIPRAFPDRVSVSQDGILNVSASGVLGNDLSLGGNQLFAYLVSDTSHGQLDLADDGSFVYTPNPGYYGYDFFTYVASNGASVSETTVVAIEVVPVTLWVNDGGPGQSPIPQEDLQADQAPLPPKAISRIAAGIKNIPQTPPASPEQPQPVINGVRHPIERHAGSGNRPETISTTPIVQTSRGGNEQLGGENNLQRYDLHALAAPVDDDLLLNSAHLEGDESAFVFDRIIKQGTTVKNADSSEAKDAKIPLSQAPGEDVSVNEQFPHDEVFLENGGNVDWRAIEDDGEEDELSLVETTEVDELAVSLIAVAVTSERVSHSLKSLKKKSGQTPSSLELLDEDPRL